MRLEGLTKDVVSGDNLGTQLVGASTKHSSKIFAIPIPIGKTGSVKTPTHRKDVARVHF